MESENITNHDYSDVVYLGNLESGRQLGLAGINGLRRYSVTRDLVAKEVKVLWPT